MNFNSSSGINFHYEYDSKPNEPFSLLFLHGFTGSSNDWNGVREGLKNQFDIYTLDLIGHGLSDSPTDGRLYDTSHQIMFLREFIENVIQAKTVIIGYSMGGRLALQFSIEHQDLISGLIIESSTPGIERIGEKEERKEWDKSIARMIEENGMKYFAEYWVNLPILKNSYQNASLPIKNIINLKSRNNPVGLANSLRHFGAGSMPDCWNKLSSLNIPVGVIYGEMDNKYSEISQRIVQKIDGAVIYPVEKAGHITHLEKPAEFINFVDQFCNKLKSKG